MSVSPLKSNTILRCTQKAKTSIENFVSTIFLKPKKGASPADLGVKYLMYFKTGYLKQTSGEDMCEGG